MSDKLKIMQEKLTGPDYATEDNNLVPVPQGSVLEGGEQPSVEFPQEASAN